jgi:alpha-beta hydrolase superfamily lysophospholipase
VEPFKELSFWGRKSAAEQVGHGAVIEALSELEELRNHNNLTFADEIAKRLRMSTKLFIVGHSFGGDIVYSAVAPILKERMVENFDQNGKPIPPRTLGDLVVLINPAFEAARFETTERLATVKPFPSVTNCVLAVFTSTADTATGFFFPLGRRFSTLFDTYENAEQGKANITAVGHYQPYIDYDLKVGDSTAVTEAAVATNKTTTAASSATNAVHVAKQIERTARRAAAGTNATRDDLTYTFGHVQLIPRTNCIRQDPVFNIAVDPKIIPDHDTITLPIFTRFLSEFLTAFSSSVE